MVFMSQLFGVNITEIDKESQLKWKKARLFTIKLEKLWGWLTGLGRMHP